jgi:hypothetical protein
MTKLKAIAIAAIATLIFGSLAVGIAANTGDSSTHAEAGVDTLTSNPISPATPAGNIVAPTQEPVLAELSDGDRDDRYTDDDDDDDLRGRDDDDHDNRGRDHPEDD